MYFFGNHEDALRNDNWALLGGSSTPMDESAHCLRTALLGDERPRDMMVLLSILVVLLHLWLVQWLNQSDETVTEAKPMIMNVSMITIPVSKPAVTPPQPAPPPPEKKPLPKKTPAKPVEKKPPPVVQKAPEFAPSEQVVEPAREITQAASSPTASVSETRTAPVEQFVQAKFSANYLHNPEPEYPRIAKSRGWTGKVILKVRVSADGTAESVEVDQSSGHDILDENAIEAVKKWRFTPAKRGETPVADTVKVPVDYKLKNN